MGPGRYAILGPIGISTCLPPLGSRDGQDWEVQSTPGIAPSPLQMRHLMFTRKPPVIKFYEGHHEAKTDRSQFPPYSQIHSADLYRSDLPILRRRLCVREALSRLTSSSNAETASLHLPAHNLGSSTDFFLNWHSPWRMNV